MKRTAAFLLLVTMLYNIAGYYVATGVTHRQVKRHMRQLIAHAENLNGLTEVLTESFSNYVSGKGRIQRVNHKEIRCNGKMYDVVSVTRKGDIVYFKVISDEREDGLLAGLKRTLQEQNEHSGQQSHPVLKGMVKDFLPPVISNFSITGYVQTFGYPELDPQHTDWVADKLPRPSRVG